MDQLRVLGELRAWTSDDPNIRLVVITGSVARGGDAGDELSDIDVELYARDPQPLLGNREWYKPFGQVLVVEELENPMASHATHLLRRRQDRLHDRRRGCGSGVEYDCPFQVLVDKDGLSGHLRVDPRGAPVPTPAEISTCINWFYADALMCARSLVRDELWMAKTRDWDMKTQLLKMIE
jgi:aminoglycoside 6-adenylyltransferase